MSPSDSTEPADLRAGWSPGSIAIPTRWTSSVSPEAPRDGYPRPQLVRPAWQSLNGLWDYAVTPWGAGEPTEFEGRILVPFPIESALSGVQRALLPEQWLWYRREFEPAPVSPGGRVLLHFDAVDFEAAVYVNGAIVGSHSGGYQRFTFDISAHVHEGANELVVRVTDPTSEGPNPNGKQTLNPVFVYYTASSGIWQTVWLENVPAAYIRGLRIDPDLVRAEVRVAIDIDGGSDDLVVEAVLSADGAEVDRVTGALSDVALRVTNPRAWSPEDPFLYDLDVRIVRDGVVIDEVRSYAGLRSIEVRRDESGIQRIFLNGQQTFNLGIVDQGFWPDGLYSAPTDDAIRFDVAMAKSMGFNSIRKHIKVEPQRWYHECDRLGILVWQDMPSGPNGDPLARAHFERELEENIALLRNHPSIVCWVPFNEGWGAYDQERIARRVRELDPSRLVNAQSGSYDWLGVNQFWHRRAVGGIEATPQASFDDMQMLQWDGQGTWLGGDLADIHFYPGPRMGPPMAGMARVTGEHGSFGCYVEGHVWNELARVGTGLGAARLTPEELTEAYRASVEEQKRLEADGLSGSYYFELSDVEQEQQGLLTYDRAVVKIPLAELRAINARLAPTRLDLDVFIRDFPTEDVDPEPEGSRTIRAIAARRVADGDPEALRRLALSAVRLGLPEAPSLVAEALGHAAQPYTEADWRFVLVTTTNSTDPGFDMLRDPAGGARAVLGADAVMSKLVRIVEEELSLRIEGDDDPDWVSITRDVVEKYPDLGGEVIDGARMMDARGRGDWTAFGRFYDRYYRVATLRSRFPFLLLSSDVFEHVVEPAVLYRAIDCVQRHLNADIEDLVLRRGDPIKLDIYANLLYKVGRTHEALVWQESAVRMSQGRSREIDDRYRKMIYGRQTWRDE